MPFKIIPAKDGFNLYNTDKKRKVDVNYKTKTSAKNAAKNFMKYEKRFGKKK